MTPLRGTRCCLGVLSSKPPTWRRKPHLAWCRAAIPASRHPILEAWGASRCLAPTSSLSSPGGAESLPVDLGAPRGLPARSDLRRERGRPGVPPWVQVTGALLAPHARTTVSRGPHSLNGGLVGIDWAGRQATTVRHASGVDTFESLIRRHRGAGDLPSRRHRHLAERSEPPHIERFPAAGSAVTSEKVPEITLHCCQT